MSAHPTFPARRQVSWDWDAFTSLFGMGRGGTRPNEAPTSKSRSPVDECSKKLED